MLLFFGAIAHRVMVGYLGLPLLSRVYYYRITGVVLAIGFFWFALRISNITMRRVRAHAIAAGRIGTGKGFDSYPLRTTDSLGFAVGALGLLGAVTSRAEAQVLRISMIYALLDGNGTIDRRTLNLTGAEERAVS